MTKWEVSSPAEKRGDGRSGVNRRGKSLFGGGGGEGVEGVRERDDRGPRTWNICRGETGHYGDGVAGAQWSEWKEKERRGRERGSVLSPTYIRPGRGQGLVAAGIIAAMYGKIANEKPVS